MKRVLSLILLAVFGCGEPPGDRKAEHAELLEHADSAFVGEVVSLEDTMAPFGDGRLLPHTLVTFRVEEAVKSAEAGELVTLSFAGGPFGDGRALKVSHVPTFRVGDRDLLFVQGNGRLLCPLVGCDRGRIPSTPRPQ